MASAAPSPAPSNAAAQLSAISSMTPPADADAEDAPLIDEYGRKDRTGRAKDASTLKKRLEAQIDDINLARYLDEPTLREIGMRVVDDFEIDENSRADWVADAEKAMKFAMQRTDEKQFPWPGASNVMYPLIPQAAIEFASRTYPAVVQGRNVVKGVVWGSDRGTPVMEGGKPKMQPPQPGMGAPAGADPGAPNPGAPPQPAPQAEAEPEPVWLIAPGEKSERAKRVGEHMSWQLLEEMPEWETQTDQLLHQIPVVGGAVRKTYRNLADHRNESLFVSLINLVWNYNAPSFEAAPRHTEKLIYYPSEIEDFERIDMDAEGEGMFLALDYGPGDGLESNGTTYGWRRDQSSGGDQSDPDAPHLFLEQHRRWDLDGDGYAEPYTITVHRRSCKVVRIVARYDKEGIEASKDGNTIIKIEPVEHYTLIPFFPSIDGGSYPMGFGHLIRGLNDQINTTLNQMFDAGTLQNAGGGFIGDALNVPSGQTLFQVGKYIRVNSKGGPIRDNVLPIDFKGPSPVLFQLLGTLIEAGKGLASLQNVLAGDADIANAPPTTVLALIEQGLKTYTAIMKRVFRALKKEYGKLYRLNRLYVTEPVDYRLGDDERQVHPSDYAIGGGVVPIADPKMVTDMQRLAHAEIIMSFKDDPDINQREIKRRMLEAADVDRIDDLFAAPDPMLAAAAQMQMALQQAELGRTRAAEQKDATQAFLNLAMARTKVNDAEEKFIADQLQYLRLRIESLNTEVRAADVAGKHHAIGLDHMDRVSVRAHELAMQEGSAGSSGGASPPAVAPTPGPTGGFPVPPDSGGGGPAAVQPPAPGAPAIPARAAGGPVQAGQPYLVGEQGPEVIVPGQDGQVIPNQPAVPDMTASYNTRLEPDREKEFQQWIKTSGREHDLRDYDMRGAWSSGAQQSDNGHFPDTFKKPNHPTFSSQSQYHGKDGYIGGDWEDMGGGDWIFAPSDTNLKMRSPSQLRRYLQQHDPSVMLVMPRPKPAGK